MTLDLVNTQLFFKSLLGDLQNRKASAIVVTHILPDKIAFLEALSKLVNIAAIIPKPNSIDNDTMLLFEKKYKIAKINRNSKEYKKDLFALMSSVKKKDENIFLLDMGGYFSEHFDEIQIMFGDKLLGIIEDTENGIQKYNKLKNTNGFLIHSVARSWLKEPEDYLVGESIVFSSEHILRSFGQIFTNKEIGIVGYGKIGSSIAAHLFAKNTRCAVFDTSSIARIRALSRGFDTPNKDQLLLQSDVIFCATGNKSIKNGDFKKIKKGAFIAMATSPDDEIDMNYLEKHYHREKVSAEITLFKNTSNHFYLLNNGNTVNFLHKAVVGPFIQLIQGEIIMLVQNIIENNGELTDEQKEKISDSWINCFYNFKE